MKNTRVSKILFLYTSGRKERIEKVNDEEAPREFLYGYTYFKEMGMDVDYMETDYLYPKWFDRQYWRLKRDNQKFVDHLAIGNRSHIFLNQIADLNNYDTLIATTDSIALGLAHHRKKGRLNADIIYINMGLAGSLYNLKKNSNGNFGQYKKKCETLINHCKSIISLGKAEFQFFIEEYPHLAEKFVFIPFGIDTDFWTPTDSIIKADGQFILFVGNDLNRDYDLLLKIAENSPDINFRFITSRLKQGQCPNNVIVTNGSLKKYSLSDVELRKFYHRAEMIIIPLEETLQPSGQSVALQSMACKAPIIITKTDGIWDIDIMKHLKNCFFVSPGDLNGFLKGIDFILDTPGENKRLGYNGRRTVERYYNCQQFAEKLHSYI